MQDATATAAKMTYLKALAAGIHDAYDCYSLHIASDVVSARLGKKWVNVQVETFKLVNCEAGTKCFAWLEPEAGGAGSSLAAVIATAAINTPQAAVQSFRHAQTQPEQA